VLCTDGQHSSSSLDVSPQQDEYRCFSHGDLSDSDSSDEGNCRGIVNPNYPGFQHLARHLLHSDTDDTEEDGDACNNNNSSNNNNIYKNNNNNNNNGREHTDDCLSVIESKIDSVNHLDSVENFQKHFYDKPKFNIPVESDCYCVGHGDCISVVPLDGKDLNVHLPESDVLPKDGAEIAVSTEEPENSAEVDRETLVTNMAAIAVSSNTIAASPGVDPHQMNSSKMSDAFLSGAKEDLLGCGTTEEDSVRIKHEDVMIGLDCAGLCAESGNSRNLEDSNRVVEEWEKKETAIEKFSKEQTASEKEKDDDSVVPRKKEKMEINYSVKKNRSKSCTNKMDLQPSAPVLQQQEQLAGAVVRRHDFGSRGARDHVLANRRSVPAGTREKKQSSTEILGTYSTCAY
jgi:hypothetical protein